MNRFSYGLLLMGVIFLGGCKKEQPAPPPAPVQVVAPVVAPVEPGMELVNPAEKEGQP